MPRWEPGDEFGSDGSSLRRNNDGMDRGAAVEMLRGGPGYIFKELMIRFANGMKEWS